MTPAASDSLEAMFSVRARTGSGLLVLAPLLAACAGGTATVESAPQAADPRCAEVMLAMPEEVDGMAQRQTDAQGTSVWGDPSRVVVRCGVEPPGPSPEVCVSAEGVDWLAVEETRAEDVVVGEGEAGDADQWRLVSYGREPAVEVLLDAGEVPSSTVMLAMAGAVEIIEQTRECTETEQNISESEGTETSDEVDVEDEVED